MKHRFLAGWSLLSLAVLLLGMVWVPSAPCDKTDVAEVQASDQAGPRFIAYYFFTNKRCGPCKRIEQWAHEAITDNFKDQIAAGRLQWQALNVELPENKHYIEDFQLYTKSVVITEYQDGKPIRWEILEDVWTLYRDREKYFDYLTRKTRAFMEKS